MLVVDLSALSKPELHRLLAAARSHKQPSLAAELVAELGFREGGVGPATVSPAAARPGRTPVSVVLALAAATVTIGVWGLMRMPPEPTEVAAAPLALVVRSQAPRPMALPAIAAPPSVAEPAMEPQVRRAEPTRAPQRALLLSPATAPNPCYRERTPADRLVCGYPKLGAQDRRLREAYVQALAAGARAEDLDAEQKDWKAARDDISDRARLADAYADRILALEEAARTARASEPVV